MTNSERTPLELAPDVSADAEVRATVADWDTWFTPGRFAVLLFLLLLAAFPEVWTGTHTFFYRDYGCFGYPLAQYHREAFWRGEIPLWNPLNNCGLPHLAQWNTMTFYPLSILYLVGPMPWALGIFALGHLFLAGLGMYFLAHRWTGHRFAASVAGVAWALNGLTLHALMWPNNIAALAWMPLVVLLAGRAAHEGGRAMLLAALAGATQVLSGAPEMVLFTWLLAGALSLLEAGPLRPRVLRLAGVALVVGGLTALQLFPFLDLLRHSQRDGHFTTSVWAMPAWGLVNFIVPLFRCSPSITGGVFSQTEQQWTSSYYAGLAVLVLAVMAAWRIRERRVWLLVAIVVATLVLALGDATFVYPLCRKFVPGFNVIRFPIKFVVPALFALPLLAALAVAFWLRLPKKSQPAERPWGLRPHCWLRSAGGFEARPVIWAGVVFVAVVLIAAVAQDEKGQFSLNRTLLNGLARAAFLVLIFTTLKFMPRGGSGRVGLFCRLGVLLALGLDALTHAPRQNPTVPVEVYAPDAARRDWTPPSNGARAMMHPRTKAYLDYAAHPDTLLFCLGQRRALVPNWNLLEAIPVVGGFYALYTREQQQVQNLFQASTNFPAGLADFLAVTRISSAQELFGWTERARAQPWVNAGQRPAFLSEAETLRRLAAPDFNSAHVVCLPEAARDAVRVDQPGQAVVVSASAPARTLRVEVEAEAPSLVTVAQTHYHWWTATVNGQPARLWPANHAFQALVVPAGRSVVELAYRDRSFMWGAVVSVATLLGCAVWGWRLRLNRSVGRASSLPGGPMTSGDGLASLGRAGKMPALREGEPATPNWSSALPSS